MGHHKRVHKYLILTRLAAYGDHQRANRLLHSTPSPFAHPEADLVRFQYPYIHRANGLLQIAVSTVLRTNSSSPHLGLLPVGPRSRSWGCSNGYSERRISAGSIRNARKTAGSVATTATPRIARGGRVSMSGSAALTW